MTPAWIKRSGSGWMPGWLVDGSPSGAGEGYVLVAYDDEPTPNWNYPAGSLRLTRIRMDDVRLRRTAIPLNDPVPHEGAKIILPDAANRGPALPGTELRSS